MADKIDVYNRDRTVVWKVDPKRLVWAAGKGYTPLAEGEKAHASCKDCSPDFRSRDVKKAEAEAKAKAAKPKPVAKPPASEST
tara:strand:- start:447 stop:695 length:249 start_codon:yes stop_codon:yes gene_type:complete